MTDQTPRTEARTALDAAWKELIADGLRRNVVVAVGKHRAAIEAEAAQPAHLDERRLARALATSSHEWLFRDHMDTYERAAVTIARAYREDSDD